MVNFINFINFSNEEKLLRMKFNSRSLFQNHIFSQCYKSKSEITRSCEIVNYKNLEKPWSLNESLSNLPVQFLSHNLDVSLE